MKHLVGILAVLVALSVITAVGAEDEKENANKVGGGYIVYPNKQGTVVFSHLAHSTVAGFKCEACHPAIAQKKGNVKMADIQQGKACGQCHDGKTKAPKSGGVAFAVTDCNGCHMPDKPIVLKTKGPGPVSFSHAKHTGSGNEVEAGYACGDCHPKPFEQKAGAPIGMKFPHKDAGCATCHNGKTTSPQGATAKAVNLMCMKCHTPKAG